MSTISYYEKRNASLNNSRAVVVAQLVERSLPTSEIRGSNPDIGNIFYTRISTDCNKIEKTKIREKRQGMAHL